MFLAKPGSQAGFSTPLEDAGPGDGQGYTAPCSERLSACIVLCDNVRDTLLNEPCAVWATMPEPPSPSEIHALRSETRSSSERGEAIARAAKKCARPAEIRCWISADNLCVGLGGQSTPQWTLDGQAGQWTKMGAKRTRAQ